MPAAATPPVPAPRRDAIRRFGACPAWAAPRARRSGGIPPAPARPGARRRACSRRRAALRDRLDVRLRVRAADDRPRRPASSVIGSNAASKCDGQRELGEERPAERGERPHLVRRPARLALVLGPADGQLDVAAACRRRRPRRKRPSSSSSGSVLIIASPRRPASSAAPGLLAATMIGGGSSGSV